MTYEQFIEQLKQFCIERGFEISGTCYSECIYGEITVARIGADPGWRRWEENKFNFADAAKEDY